MVLALVLLCCCCCRCCCCCCCCYRCRCRCRCGCWYWCWRWSWCWCCCRCRIAAAQFWPLLSASSSPARLPACLPACLPVVVVVAPVSVMWVVVVAAVAIVLVPLAAVRLAVAAPAVFSPKDTRPRVGYALASQSLISEFGASGLAANLFKTCPMRTTASGVNMLAVGRICWQRCPRQRASRVFPLYMHACMCPVAWGGGLNQLLLLVDHNLSLLDTTVFQEHQVAAALVCQQHLASPRQGVQRGGITPTCQTMLAALPPGPPWACMRSIEEPARRAFRGPASSTCPKPRRIAEHQISTSHAWSLAPRKHASGREGCRRGTAALLPATCTFMVLAFSRAKKSIRSTCGPGHMTRRSLRS